MKLVVMLFVAVLVLSGSALAIPNPNRTVHVDYSVEVWQPGTLDMGNCPTSVDFTFEDYAGQDYPNYDVGYGDIECEINVSGHVYHLQVSPGVIDYKPTPEHPDGYKTFIQYITMSAVEDDVLGVNMNAYTDMPPSQTVAYVSQTGNTLKLHGNSLNILDRLRFNFKMTDGN